MEKLGNKAKIVVVYPYGDDKDGEYMCQCGGYLREVKIYNGSEVCYTNGGIIEYLYKCNKCGKYYEETGSGFYHRDDVVYDERENN